MQHEIKLKLLGPFAWLYNARGGLASRQGGGKGVASHPPPLLAQLAQGEARSAGRSTGKGQRGVGGAILSHFHFQRPCQDVLSHLKTQVRNHKLFPSHASLTFIMLLNFLLKTV